MVPVIVDLKIPYKLTHISAFLAVQYSVDLLKST